ncbi:MAG: hypothetical protein JKY54_00115 [Flavobacteriales bacterium]|nr:hypothetical protein [Flavobacteriales bacterium]
MKNFKLLPITLLLLSGTVFADNPIGDGPANSFSGDTISPQESMSLSENQTIAFSVYEQNGEESFYDSRYSIFVGTNFEYKVNSTTKKFIEICNENECLEVNKSHNLLYSTKKEKVLLKDGRIFQVGDVVDLTDGTGEIMAISVNPHYYRSGPLRGWGKHITRNALIKIKASGKIEINSLSTLN